MSYEIYARIEAVLESEVFAAVERQFWRSYVSPMLWIIAGRFGSELTVT